jgi:hypothetical protein
MTHKTAFGPAAAALGLPRKIPTQAIMITGGIPSIMASISVAPTAEEMVVAAETEYFQSSCLPCPRARVHTPSTASPNKSLLRSGGQWYLVCKSLAVIDKLPVISLGEPPAAELNR